ncbi:MAG: hypothetical protein K0S41_3876 [Anaerocolumna sp.]|nr:hypothetical protein [Anaerocolumna sp.]
MVTLNQVGTFVDTIDDCDEILNEDYKKYRNIYKELSKTLDGEMKNEFDFTIKGFLRFK